MTELDTETLRQALRAGSDPARAVDGTAVDVQAIMGHGRSLRRRRRVAGVAGALCVMAALAGAATGIAHLTASPSTSVQPAGPARPGPARPGPRRPATLPAATRAPAAVPTATKSPYATDSPSPFPSLTPTVTATPGSAPTPTPTQAPPG
jgi:hypothetical protein